MGKKQKNEVIQEERLRELLRGVNLRCTPGRMGILAVLGRADRPVTEEEIQERMMRGINRTTVYRALESFLKAGLVHRSFVRARAWHYELCFDCRKKQCHSHFTCISCGKTHCLKDVFVPLAEDMPTGFILERQQVRMEGLCAGCSRKP